MVEQKVQTGAMEIDVEKSGELENIVIRAGCQGVWVGTGNNY